MIVVCDLSGEVSIDDALIVNAEDGIIEMSNGCVCCTSK